MRERGWLVVLLLSVATVTLGQEQVSPTVDISGSGFNVESNGTVFYAGCQSITGVHDIHDGDGHIPATASFGPKNGDFYVTSYNGTIRGASAYTHCYRANVSATGSCGTTQRVTSSQYCAPAETVPPPQPSPVPDPGPGGCISDCDGTTMNTTGTGSDPILFNLGNGPWKLTGLEAPVLFDLNNTGHRDRIGWTAADAEIAFLALDRNGNGRIDDGGELFGNGTRLSDGTNAPNGFDALAELDENGDGVIDEKDSAWSRLLLWTDRNHDGVSQEGEILPVTASSITSIELDHHWTGRRDVSGNAFGFKAHLKEGSRTSAFYDVFFVH